MDLEKLFTGGRMEKDADERFISQGVFRDATNIRVATSQGSDAGAVENIQGNIQITDIVDGGEVTREFECLGSLADDENERVYFWVRGVNLEGIVEYDKNTNSTVWVIRSNTPN